MINIENTTSVKEFKSLLNKAKDTDLVCIRQCVGTDFPPFISIESKSEHERMNNEGEFECLTL